MRNARVFFLLILALLLAARLCHLEVLWAEETLPLAAAGQMLHGKSLYGDIWFDKPPLLAIFYLPLQNDIVLRLVGTFYGLLSAALAYRFARDLWSRREGFWAAGLVVFYLIFDIPSAVTPLAADLLILAPHIAAVYLAWRGRTFWSGVLAGVAFLVNAKGLFVLAACALFASRALPALALGFALPNAIGAACLWWTGALLPYYEQVWKWGRVYAGETFLENPLWNGIVRTANWAGFHAAPVIAACWFWTRERKPDGWRWLGWAVISLAAVAAGWRFFPRYFFQLLPVATIAGARGFTLLGRRRAAGLALLLLIPLVRFGPRYGWLAVHGPNRWRDAAMDQDSRAAARMARAMAAPGDTLFVWGFRPELYRYTDLPAASRFLDSQPLTGVPADRHLTQSQPVASEFTRANRAELARSRPTFILDGLGAYNPRLALERYPDLHDWLAGYEPVARTAMTRIYQRRER